MRKIRNKQKQSGFTIIEVMIVLAIAGLIMAIVFVAVPQLQRNQRDNARQGLGRRLKAEAETYAANNQGTYPFAAVSGTWTSCNAQAVSGQNCGAWYTNYLNGKVNITDPGLGANATICYSNATTAIVGSGAGVPGTVGTCSGNWTQGMVWVAVGDKCNGDNITAGSLTGSATSKQYAVLTALDRQGTFYCVDNG